MKTNRIFSSLFFASLCVFAGWANAQDAVDFKKQIEPIFQKHCFKCHGGENEEAFRIDTKADVMAYIDETAEDSDLYNALISDDEEYVMPPPDFEHQLNADQITLVKTWINEGANWGDGSAAVADSVDDEEKKETTPVDPKTQRIFNAVGSLHAAAIHLPIGLLLAAGLFALLSLRGNFVMSDCAYYCLWLGVIGAIFASVSGWYFSPMENRGTVETFTDIFNDEHPVYWHRLGALITTILGLIVALFAASARSRDPDEGVLWKIGAIVLAGAVGWVGHTGGELHYPSDHYKDIEGIYQDMIGASAVEPITKDAEAEDTTDESDDDDDTSQVGQTSGDA